MKKITFVIKYHLVADRGIILKNQKQQQLFFHFPPFSASIPVILSIPLFLPPSILSSSLLTELMEEQACKLDFFTPPYFFFSLFHFLAQQRRY